MFKIRDKSCKQIQLLHICWKCLTVSVRYCQCCGVSIIDFERIQCNIQQIIQLTFTFSKLTIETLEKGAKYVLS